MVAFEKERPNEHSIRDWLTFFPHLHSQIELFYMCEGETSVTVNGKSYICHPGEVCFIFPYQVHKFRDLSPLRAYFLILNTESIAGFKNIFNKMEPKTPVIKAPEGECRELFRRLATLRRTPLAYPVEEERGLLLLLLCSLFPHMNLMPCTPESHTVIQRIVFYCNENYNTEISLDSVAGALNLSRYYISHVFNEKLKCGFSEYINILRIRDACAQLKSSDKAIAEIALSVGYANLRSFYREFAHISGCTPAEYRKNQSNGSIINPL